MKKRYRIPLLLLLAALLLGLRFPAYAAPTEPAVLQQRVTDSAALLYVRGIGQEGVSAAVGTRKVSGAAVDCADGSVPVVTWLLLDNSLSIHAADRDRAKELLVDLVAARAVNERFNLCTISEHLYPLVYDSQDYAELKSQIENIQSYDQETYLTDVLDELLRVESQREGTEYVRVLVISDGVDNNPGGITREELEKKLEQDNIPIYSVGCRGNAAELKEMYALSRQTGARYWAFSELSGTAGVAGAMSREELPAQVTVPIPPELRDGAPKGVQLTFDSGTVIQTQVNMPFGEYTPTPPPAPTAAAAPAATPRPTPAPTPVPEPTFADRLREHWAVIVGGAVLLLLLVPAVILLVNRKKKAAPVRTSPEPSAVQPSVPSTNHAPSVVPEERTMALGGGDSSEETAYLGPSGGGRRTVLILEDLGNASRRFEAPLPNATAADSSGAEDSGEETLYILRGSSASEPAAASCDEVRVGRKPDNDVIIDYDRTISGNHCVLTVYAGAISVRDLNSKNGTYADGIPVSGECGTVLRNGGTLQLGGVSFRVTVCNVPARRYPARSGF